MRIFDMQTEQEADVHTLSATVSWEDNDREKVEVFFRVYGENGYVSAADYNAFLVACAVPALHHRERRIQIDGAVCPWLVNNITTMMAYLNHWYWYEHQRLPEETVAIEAKEYVSHPVPPDTRVGMFFSGGVDSLHSLRKNQLRFAKTHPGRIRDLIFLHGFDSYGNRPKQGTEEEAFWFFVKECEPIAEDAQVNIVPVWTNLRRVGMEDTGLFVREGCGAALGAVAHVLSEKLTNVLIASSDTIVDLVPYGSHPLTDTRLSSFSLRIDHDGERFNRLEKVKALSDWQVGLDHLRVCFEGGPGTLNCGECEKCLRTKLALFCTGVLKGMRVFKNNDLSVDLVLKAFNATDGSITHSKELIVGLWRTGHLKFAWAVVAKAAHYYLTKFCDLREMVTWVDKYLLSGQLKRWYYRFQ